MPNKDVEKFVKDEIEKLATKINRDIQRIQLFSETYLLILLDLALINDARERLTRVLKAVSTDFPQPILEIYVKQSVSRAKETNIEFEAFADCLIQGLGDRAKELNLTGEIAKVYGFKAGERWEAIMKGSNNPKASDCPKKVLKSP
jgi:hypothetical protein